MKKTYAMEKYTRRLSRKSQGLTPQEIYDEELLDDLIEGFPQWEKNRFRTLIVKGMSRSEAVDQMMKEDLVALKKQREKSGKK